MEKLKKNSFSSQGCTVNLQGCGVSVTFAAGPFNKLKITIKDMQVSGLIKYAETTK
jgi:hypothetical protein